MRITVTCLLAALLLLDAPSALPQAKARTVWDGVYTEAQATRGKAAYETRCARCHGPDFMTLAAQGFPLQGDAFVDLWREDSLGALFNFVKANMPKGGENPSDGSDRPATVSDKDKLDILAWILKANEMPAGGEELSAASVATTMLVGRDGPKPLPNLTTVSVVGCLTPAPNNAWTLTSAADPKRTEDPLQATPEELTSAAARAAGTQTLRLQNLPNLTTFKPEENKGHRVLVKGILYTSNLRVNVTAAVPVSGNCTP